MLYKMRINGATCTIFVPYNCNNNCPFCNNKKEYDDTSNFSETNIIKSIKYIDSILPNCDFVLTGGEPLANIKSLQNIINSIPLTHKLYINTTIPKSLDIDSLYNFINNNATRINCINISRHLNNNYVNGHADYIINRLNINKRINCVVYNTEDIIYIPEFISRFKKFNIPIQFRDNYNYTTLDNLYDFENDPIYKYLSSKYKVKYIEGNRIRNNTIFEVEDYRLSYHKTLPLSTIKEEKFNILYDILIKQDGRICSDWDNSPLNIDLFNKIKFEPDDTHRIYSK